MLRARTALGDELFPVHRYRVLREIEVTKQDMFETSQKRSSKTDSDVRGHNQGMEVNICYYPQ
jgi:hypothetical protein